MMATLYDVSVSAINQHLKRIFEDNELVEESVIKKYLITASDGKSYSTKHYNLQAIIAVGFKVNNDRAVRFRKWAGQIVKDYTIQGWTMDKERLKKGHMFTDEYFERQLENIREIRLSERKFYQKVTDLYATAFDYDKDAKTTRQFFKMVQNKMHWAVHRHTAAELIVERANAEKEHMGLTTWESAPDDELELDRIGDRKTAVFFTISDTTPTYNFLVALAFSQMFNLLCERADNVHGGRLPHHVRVLWDEAANTGQVPQLEKIVAVIRSREISLTLFYQQLAQCKAIYDKHAETILGNMDSVIFLGGREASTIKEISENWLGKATISMQTDSRSRGQSESYSQNNQRLGRELMTPSELATMPGDKCILQLRGLPPFYSPKYDLKKHPNYRYTAEADKKKNAFDLDRLINRRRRPGPDELCEVYAVAVPDDGLTSEDEDILNYDDIDDPDAFA